MANKGLEEANALVQLELGAMSELLGNLKTYLLPECRKSVETRKESVRSLADSQATFAKDMQALEELSVRAKAMSYELLGKMKTIKLSPPVPTRAHEQPMNAEAATKDKEIVLNAEPNTLTELLSNEHSQKQDAPISTLPAENPEPALPEESKGVSDTQNNAFIVEDQSVSRPAGEKEDTRTELLGEVKEGPAEAAPKEEKEASEKADNSLVLEEDDEKHGDLVNNGSKVQGRDNKMKSSGLLTSLLMKESIVLDHEHKKSVDKIEHADAKETPNEQN